MTKKNKPGIYKNKNKKISKPQKSREIKIAHDLKIATLKIPLKIPLKLVLHSTISFFPFKIRAARIPIKIKI